MGSYFRMCVSYSLSYGTWERLAGRNGFSSAQLRARVPGRFFSEIYSAMNMQ